uniref:Glyoxalase/fosfomycin resistance/dioxygenase domain-containing protein n=1 Tax=Oryza meridionalis TaxID=40149 RepID=A0A0E0DX97_9ORYZ
MAAAATATATLRWVLQMHRDVPRAARFYSEGLDFSVNVCTLRWAELQSGPLKLALMHTNDRLQPYDASMGTCLAFSNQREEPILQYGMFYFCGLK